MSREFTTAHIARQLRFRADQMVGQGLDDVAALLVAANEIDRLNESGAWADLRDYMDEQLNNVKEMIMALTAEVQALVDQVAANVSAEHSQAAVQAALSGQIATLTAQLANVQAGAPIDAADLAAIVAQTALLKDSVTALMPAVAASVAPAAPADPTAAPAPVDPATVAAAAAATPAPADPAAPSA